MHVRLGVVVGAAVLARIVDGERPQRGLPHAVVHMLAVLRADEAPDPYREGLTAEECLDVGSCRLIMDG